MRVAITGATGFVGSHLAEAFVARGHEVTALARSPQRLRWIGHLPLRVVFGSLDSPAGLRELCSGQDVLVHAAGLTRGGSIGEFVRVNVEGTVRTLETCLACNPGLRRFLYVSSHAAMGPNQDETPLAEDDEQRPISSYGRSKALAERALASFSGRVPITIVRPAWTFGPRDQDTLALFRLAARGIELLSGPRNRYSIVFVRNLAQGIAAAAERAEPGIRAYFFADDESPTTAEVSAMIARAIGRRTLRLRVPVAVAAVAAAGAELVGTVSGHPPLWGWRKLGEIRNPYWIVSGRRAREELGYRAEVGTEEAMRETAAWYRDTGWL